MALDNLISVEFTDTEIEDIENALAIIENTIKGKTVNLTALQRLQNSRLGDKTENFVNKVSMYMVQKPEIIPVFVDSTELNKDISARNNMVSITKRLKSISEALDDTNMLIGNDIYNCVLSVYRNIKLLSKQNVPGINAIFDDLKKQFTKGKKTKTE